MNLIIDIGNTRSKLGVFLANELIKQTNWKNGWTINDLDHWLQDLAINHIALSTTAREQAQLEQQLSARANFLRLDHTVPLPINNLYKSPKTLGKDRLAAVAGANFLYPGKHCLVIDAGTCVTYDFIDHESNYHGGSISPGIHLRLRAMHEFTARLPLVTIKEEVNLIGEDTETALRSGGQLGAVLEAAEVIRRYKIRFGRLRVVLTGGDAEYFGNNLKTRIFTQPDLVLIGLNAILNYNVKKRD